MTDPIVLRRGAVPEPPAPPPEAQVPGPGAPPRQRPKASHGPLSVPRRLAGRDPNTPYRSPWADSPDRRTPAPTPTPEPTPPPEPLPSFAAAPDTSNGDNRAANEVYGFLSNFTAGVQRGLDEARKDAEDSASTDSGDDSD